MNKKVLILLTLITGQAMAMEPMELTIDHQQAMPTNTTEQKVVVILQDGQEKELLARYVPLIGTLKNLREDLPESSGIPLPEVSLATWQLIETQLERVYKSTQGDTQSKNDIIADYNQHDSTLLIGLVRAVDYLDIPLLKEITLEVAKNKLADDEFLELPRYACNAIIRNKALSLAGPLLLSEIAVCKGHEDSIKILTVTSDCRIVSRSSDNNMRIWDINGHQLAICRGHQDDVYAACVTSDSKIVSGSQDHTVRIWDISGKEQTVCRGHTGAVASVCVTPDGKRIVSGSEDGTLRIWDMNGKELVVCTGHEHWVTSVCVTPDGKRIVSGSCDSTVRIWDMNGQELAVCSGHASAVTQIHVMHDGKIASGSLDNTVRFWDVHGQPLAVWKGHEVVWSIKDQLLTDLTMNAPLKAIQDIKNQLFATLSGSESQLVWRDLEVEVWSICITHDGKIVSGFRDNTLRISDIYGRELAVCMGHEGPVDLVCVTPDGKIVSAACGEPTVRIWDISLLDRLANMNKKQAQAILKILQSYTRKQCWKEIEKILEKEEEVVVEEEELIIKSTSWCPFL